MSWLTSEFWVSSCCWVAKLCLASVVEALQIELGVDERRLVCRLFGLGLIGARLEGAGIDLGEQIAGLDHLPSAKAILTIWPSTRLRTVTVFSALNLTGARRNRPDSRRAWRPPPKRWRSARSPRRWLGWAPAWARQRRMRAFSRRVRPRENQRAALSGA